MHSTTSSLHVSATDMSEARSRRADFVAPVWTDIADEKFSSESSDPVWLGSVVSPDVIVATVSFEEGVEAKRL